MVYLIWRITKYACTTLPPVTNNAHITVVDLHLLDSDTSYTRHPCRRNKSARRGAAWLLVEKTRGTVDRRTEQSKNGNSPQQHVGRNQNTQMFWYINFYLALTRKAGNGVHLHASPSTSAENTQASSEKKCGPEGRLPGV